MNTLTKEKIKHTLHFLEDEINANVKFPDEKVVILKIPVRRLLIRTSTSADDLSKMFYKMRSDDVLRKKDTNDLENKHTTALDSIMLEIDIPKFLEYKKIILGEKPRPAPVKSASDSDMESKGGLPYCVVEGKWGYIKFGKYGEKIKIGAPESRHFRLLQCLFEPFIGASKTIEAVFDAIRLPKDKNDSELVGWDVIRRKNRQVTIIQNTIKELQKDNKLRGKILFEFDDVKNKIQIKYIE